MTLTLKIEAALSGSPWGSPGTWTDLTSRLRGFTMQRGRQDQTAKFEAGSITAQLDNRDQMLSPDVSGALVDRTTKGLPLCPVRVHAVLDGTPYPLFYGYLGPEAWPVSRMREESTVELQAFDALGLWAGVNLPASPWAGLVTYVAPNVWVRGDWPGPFILAGSSIPSRGSDGGNGTLTGSVDTSAVVTSIVDTDETPSMILAANCRVVAAEALAMPNGNEAKVTAACVWQCDPLSSDQRIMIMAHSGGDKAFDVFASQVTIATDTAAAVTSGNPDVVATSAMFDSSSVGQNITGTHIPAGTTITAVTSSHAATMSANATGSGSGLTVNLVTCQIICTTYTAGNVVHSYAVVPDNPEHLNGRYDDGKPHFIALWINATNAKGWADGQSTSGLTASNCIAGDMIWGASSGVVCTMDELMFWRRQVSDQAIGWMANAALGTGAPFFGDGFKDHLGRWFAIGNWPEPSPRTDQWHNTASYLFWGWGKVGSWPSNLLAGVQQTAEDTGGAVWATRDGNVRIRSGDALDNATFDSFYSTPTATFTDADPTVGPPIAPAAVGRGPVDRTGGRLDRVINQVSITAGIGNDNDPALNGVIRASDATSIARYGLREDARTVTVKADDAGALLLQAMADAEVALYSTPPAEIRDFQIFPLTDSSAAEWIVQTCELEQAVVLADHPVGSADWSIDTRVQREQWAWSTDGGKESLSVTLTLAGTWTP